MLRTSGFAAACCLPGLVTAGMVASGMDISILHSFLLMLYASAFIVFAFYVRQIGTLSLIASLLFAFPFIHLIPYVVDKPPANAALLWGLVPNPYMFDPATIALTGALGAVGLSAMAAGFWISRGAFVVRGAVDVAGRALPLWASIVLLGLALAIGQMSAPSETIFVKAYSTATPSAAEAANFGSAWLVCAIVLLLIFADAILDPNVNQARAKALLATLASLYFVIWLQFARGDREALFFTFSAAYLALVWGSRRFASTRRKLIFQISVTVMLLAVLGSGYALQKFRYIVAGNAAAIPAAPEDIVPSATSGESSGRLFKRIDTRLPYGTWSAVLMTPLSVAGDDVRGLLPKKYGKTYVDILLSLPPGIVADRLGYARPIDAHRGPAHEMRYGLGGTHAVVVPFMNFGILGVFFISALFGWLIATSDKRSANPKSPANLIYGMLFQGAMIAILPHWIWYGEKNLVTALAIWFILSALHFGFMRMRSRAG